MIKIYSAVLTGVTVEEVEIEISLGAGFSGLCLLGLPADVSRDLRERVRSALEASGCALPARRLVVSVRFQSSVKWVRTQFGILDFGIAAGIFLVLNKKQKMFHQKMFYFGELELSGQLRPFENELIVHQMQIKFPEALFFVAGNSCPSFAKWLRLTKPGDEKPGFCAIECQNHKEKSFNFLSSHNDSICEELRRKKIINFINDIKNTPQLLVTALVAAAGYHHLLVSGEPGIGKSYMARRMETILPPIVGQEIIDVALIAGTNSVAISQRPFRTPHHSISMAGLLGGASLKPGELTLSHHGALFLDEFAEFPRPSLESLREPLDEGRVCLSRAAGQVVYPARFLLIAATNPCPCGFGFSKKKVCRCNPSSKQKYQQKLSGPILDRIPIKAYIGLSTEAEQKCESLVKTYMSFSEMDQFVSRFIEVQNRAWSQSKMHSSLHKIKSLELDARAKGSLRAAQNEQRVKDTLAALFPSDKDQSSITPLFAELNNFSKLLNISGFS